MTFCGAQTLPHPPQCARSPRVSAQMPPGHSTSGAVHVSRHEPATQTPASQAAPQAPQFERSVWVLTHAPEHTLSGAAHVAAHAPLLQAWPAAHAWVQPPQCRGSLVVSTHCPPQRCWPIGQVSLHAPATHCCPLAHALLQPPQFCTSLVVSTHFPPHSVQGVGAGPTQDVVTTKSTANTTRAQVIARP